MNIKEMNDKELQELLESINEDIINIDDQIIELDIKKRDIIIKKISIHKELGIRVQ